MEASCIFIPGGGGTSVVTCLGDEVFVDMMEGSDHCDAPMSLMPP
jgi:hypothetical protein